jgi:hypothetical protein
MLASSGAGVIREDVQKLCAELCLSGKCLFTATPTQLYSDGYLATAATAKLCLSIGNQGSAGDTSIARRNSMFDTSALLLPGKPHNLLSEMKELLLKRSVPPLHVLTLRLFDAITAAERSIKRLDPTFASPIWQATEQRLAGWGEYVQKRLLSKGSKAAPVQALLQVLGHLYEAARVVVASRQAGLELAMMYLQMMHVMPTIHCTTVSLTATWERCRNQFKRCAHLKEVAYPFITILALPIRAFVVSESRQNHWHLAILCITKPSVH